MPGHQPLPKHVSWFAPWRWFAHWKPWKRWSVVVVVMLVGYVESYVVMNAVEWHLVGYQLARGQQDVTAETHLLDRVNEWFYAPLVAVRDKSPALSKFLRWQIDAIGGPMIGYGF